MKGETVLLVVLGGAVLLGGVYLLTRPKPQPVQQQQQSNPLGSLISGAGGLLALL
jgi:hypothetical protein